MTWQSARPETERNTKLVNPLENFLMESCNVKNEATHRLVKAQNNSTKSSLELNVKKKTTNKLPKG